MSSPHPFNGRVPICQRCGTQLRSNGISCEHCGYNNSLVASNNPGGRVAFPSQDKNVQQAPYGQVPRGNLQWSQMSVPPTQNSFPGQSPLSSGQHKFFGQPPATPTQNNPFGVPPIPPPQNNFATQSPVAPTRSGIRPLSSFSQQPNAQNTSYPSAQPIGNGNFRGGTSQPINAGNFYAASSPHLSASPPASAMTSSLRPEWQNIGGNLTFPESEQHKPKIGLVVGIVFIAILLVGSGFAGYAFLSKDSSPQTVNTSPTSLPTLKGPPLFADSFNNNSNGWSLQSDPGKFSAGVGNGTMVLEDDNHSMLWELVPSAKPFSDFKLVVDTVLSKGDQNNGYGVFIRGASSQSSQLATYYRFSLYGDGTYAIFKGFIGADGNSTSTMLVDYTNSSAIQKSGGLNHLMITAKGSSMTFAVNGQTLQTITDNSYTSGSVALFVINLKNSQPVAQAKFTHFGIYPSNA